MEPCRKTCPTADLGFQRPSDGAQWSIGMNCSDMAFGGANGVQIKIGNDPEDLTKLWNSGVRVQILSSLAETFAPSTAPRSGALSTIALAISTSRAMSWLSTHF
jgi:hypothetical protein